MGRGAHLPALLSMVGAKQARSIEQARSTGRVRKRAMAHREQKGCTGVELRQEGAQASPCSLARLGHSSSIQDVKKALSMGLTQAGTHNQQLCCYHCRFVVN